jgi:hypothetical protein
MIRHYVVRRAQVTEGRPHYGAVRTADVVDAPSDEAQALAAPPGPAELLKFVNKVIRFAQAAIALDMPDPEHLRS